MRHKKIFVGLAFLCFIVIGVFFHFRRDIVVPSIRCDVLESDTTFSDSRIESITHTVLVANAPYLEQNIGESFGSIWVLSTYSRRTMMYKRKVS